MKKIVMFLIISIALIGVNVVSASSDVDGFNGEIPFMVADSLRGSLDFPLVNVNISLTGPFSEHIGSDDFGGYFKFPFVAASDIPVEANDGIDNHFNGSFSLPVCNVELPLNGPLFLPIVGVDVEGPFGLPIIESYSPF